MLPDGSHSVPDIQICFKLIFKKYEEKTNNPSVRMYVNNIGNRTMFKIKTGYYLNHLTPESMKLLGRYLKTKIVKIYLI